jgi:sigma-E factor negative regulatory protein RseC
VNETDGVVVRVEGEYAWVRAGGAGHACGACARKEGCSSAGAGSLFENSVLGQAETTRMLRLPNTIHAHPGDAVVIRADDGMVLRAAWLAYGVPLLLALGGATLLLELTGSDLAAAAAALLGLVAGFFALHRKGKVSAATEPILSIEFKRAFR